MAWLLLFFAGCLEVVWAVAMKMSDGFSRPLASVISVLAMIGSMGLLALALKSLPLGSAYTVWVGIGIIGASLAGMLWLGESVTFAKLAGIVLMICAIMLLKNTT
ncbi:MAG TPA: multidrug efflux SMR transporter [Pseudomonadales bacterium]